MRHIVITPPATEPISLAEAKAHLRITDTDQDVAITRWIVVAREYVEQYLNRFVAQQTVELALDEFDTEIRLSAPLQSITSVKYTDSNGTEITLGAEDYVLDTYSQPARIFATYGSYWPTTRLVANAVRVRYVAGFADGSVPEPIRQAMLLLIGDYAVNREAQGVFQGAYQSNPAVNALLAPYRLGLGV